MKQRGSLVVIVLKAIALAMGIATIVQNALNSAALQTSVTLLGIGLFAIAAAALAEGQK